MYTELTVSVDIGSTYTKAALFRRKADPPDNYDVDEQATTTTTSDDLSKGFLEVLRNVLPRPLRQNSLAETAAEVDIRYSSSAKGGLSIAASGIVPELTAKMAEAAALSAGGRVCAVYAYRLSAEDLEEINSAAPDILLFAGGTDGGNETFLIHNSRMLAKLRSETVLIYAGNRKIRREVAEALGSRECIFADNVLPDLENPCPEDAREKISEVFLRRIVTGKGLGEIASALGRPPYPTPYAVLRWVEAAAEHSPWTEFILIDLGGATTDVYSAAGDPAYEGAMVRRGLPEPRIKRSVEGDLGMRISAPGAAHALGDDPRLTHYAETLAENPAYLPEDGARKLLDLKLAEGIAGLALIRHAGRQRRIFTAQGEVSLVTGKDLRNVGILIGSGGFLSRISGVRLLPSETFFGEEEALLPRRIRYLRDREYLIPLAANLAFENPAAAVHCVQGHLREERDSWN